MFCRSIALVFCGGLLLLLNIATFECHDLKQYHQFMIYSNGDKEGSRALLAEATRLSVLNRSDVAYPLSKGVKRGPFKVKTDMEPTEDGKQKFQCEVQTDDSNVITLTLSFHDKFMTGNKKRCECDLKTSLKELRDRYKKACDQVAEGKQDAEKSADNTNAEERATRNIFVRDSDVLYVVEEDEAGFWNIDPENQKHLQITLRLAAPLKEGEVVWFVYHLLALSNEKPWHCSMAVVDAEDGLRVYSFVRDMIHSQGTPDLSRKNFEDMPLKDMLLRIGEKDPNLTPADRAILNRLAQGE